MSVDILNVFAAVFYLSCVFYYAKIVVLIFEISVFAETKLLRVTHIRIKVFKIVATLKN